MGRKLSDYNKFMAKNLKGMKGKTKAQRQKIFKDAVRAWNAKKKGNPKPRSKPKSASSSRSSSNTTGGRRMGFNTGKIKNLIRLVSTFIPTAVIATDPNLDTQSKVKRWVTWHTGWRIDDQRWDPAQLLNGYGPRIGAEIGTRADTIVRKFIRMIG